MTPSSDTAEGGAPREEVLWFAREMERKLRLNDHKGHWDNCTMMYLFRRLREETRELDRAVSACHAGSVSPEFVWQEAADVANFAMMIADIVRRKSP